ncbi:MAG: M1 family metallopeptidase, partial [Desulfosarcinaceae bacterium]
MSHPLHPVHYNLDIRPDLERFQFKGQAVIRFEGAPDAGSVTLNTRELAIWRCRLVQDDETVPCAFSHDPAKETLTVELPRAQGEGFSLAIDYEGLINDAMDGFYRSRFRKDGRTHYLAVTQFEESSARRAFPCMDHPEHKAVFELKLTIPEHLTAIANTEPVAEETREGLKTLTFAPTPIMSTYLVFFGFGAFELARDTQDTRVRLAHLPGLADTTDLGLDFGRKALQYCEAYYGIPYPLSKMDLIAVPDFAFGAMENWGAITFRENLLLHFPETTSAEGVERICEVIAHEIAHQWFGNLV